MGQVDDRLVVEDELPALDRAPQVRPELEAGDRGLAHGGHEPLVRAAAARLGRVHRGVGVAQQVGGRVAVLGQRDADARPERHLDAADRERRDEGRGDALGDLVGVPWVRDVLEQERELVTAEPGHRVARPDRRAQPFADLLEHPVARGVPEAVVDRLEVVEVHEQDDHAPVLPASPLQGVRDAVGEQGAVREAGERVVEGLARQLGLEHLALGDVAVVDDDAADGGVVEQVAADRLHRPPRAVGVLDAALEATLGALARGEVRERLLHRAAIVVVDQRGELPALPVGRGVAEDPFQGDALEADPAVGVEDGLGVRRVLEQGPEPGLAAAQVGGQLHQPAVLARERPRRRVERAPQHQEQHGRGQPRHDEHVAARRLDELDDRGRVLVDLIGPDHRPVRRADRQVDLEVVVGQVPVELVLLGVRAAEVELARGLAVEGLHEVVVDVEGAAAQGRQVREQDRAARRPQLDPRDPTRLHEPLEERVDVAGPTSRRDRPSSPPPAGGRRSPGPWSRRSARPRSRRPRSRDGRRRRR